MQMIKDADTVKSPFKGWQSALDADARYTFSLSARCSRCGAEAFVTRYEHASGSRMIFRCSSCFSQFEPPLDSVSFM